MADETTGQPAAAAPAEVKTEVTPAKESPTVKVETKEAPKATVLEGATDKVEKEVPPDFPPDWRDKIAKGDDKRLKRLARFKSVNDLYDWGENAEKQWKRGADPDPFPSEGTDEEKSSWREAHKVPKEPKEYIKDFTLPDGLVIGENDKPHVEEFLKAAHAENRDPSAVQSDLAFFFKMRDQQIQQRMDQDEKDKVSTAETLKAEFGPDYRKYLGAAYNFLETAPEGVLGALTEARMSDGSKLGNNPQIVRWLSQVALEMNPAATVVPGAGSNSMSSIETEMAAIEQLMKSNREAYWGDPSKQARYRELLDAKDRLSKRNAA